jgi:hypothetical protein
VNEIEKTPLNKDSAARAIAETVLILLLFFLFAGWLRKMYLPEVASTSIAGFFRYTGGLFGTHLDQSLSCAGHRFPDRKIVTPFRQVRFSVIWHPGHVLWRSSLVTQPLCR